MLEGEPSGGELVKRQRTENGTIAVAKTQATTTDVSLLSNMCSE